MELKTAKWEILEKVTLDLSSIPKETPGTPVTGH